MSGRALASLAIVGAGVAAVVVGTLASAPRGRSGSLAGHRPRATTAATVAAAYRYPSHCLSVTIATGDPAYARAWLDRASPCWRYGAYVTAVFHRVGGFWRQVLDASVYACPVRWLPRVVQRQLSVCPPAANPP